MIEPFEDLIDRGKRLHYDIGLDLALGCEGERFGHVLAGADERTTNGDATRHHIKKRCRECYTAASSSTQ